jgi:hypothetical protein
MRLYYALGGGLGHLTRAQAVLRALRCEGEAAILTASPFARDPRVTGGLPIVQVPRRFRHDRGGLGRWIAATIAALAPDQLIVDSFPGGILGELCELDLPPAVHVARRLRWDVYKRRLAEALPRFEQTLMVEPLAADHGRRLRATSAAIAPLELPRITESEPLLDLPHWLVVHSGPDHETVELARYASELQALERSTAPILVISPARPSRLPPRAQWRDLYPAARHFRHAERIVTAAGFNAIHETAAVRDRHRCLPFERKLDDQFGRAAAARAAAAGHNADKIQH